MKSNDERATALWRAKLVLLFVGVPGIILAGSSLSFNILFAQTLGHDEADKVVLTAVAVAVSLLISGLPIAIDLLRRGDLRTIAVALWLGCFVFSMASAMGFSTGSRSRVAAETDAAMSDRAGLQRTIARAEGELAALPRHRPAATVQADVRAAEASVGMNCAKARSRAAREICAPVFALNGELAAATDAERIEARISQQRQRLAAMAVHGKSDAQADILSWIGAGALSPDAWRNLMGVFTALLVECGAAGCLLITGKSVAALLAPQPEVVPVPAPVAVTTAEPVEPMPMVAIDPETGWRMWFTSCVSPSKDSRIAPKDAFAHYEAWAGLNGVPDLLPYHTFGRRMAEGVEAVGGKLGNSGGRYYGDVSLAKLGMNGDPILESDKEAGE